jgi:hypothetical protein
MSTHQEAAGGWRAELVRDNWYLSNESGERQGPISDLNDLSDPIVTDKGFVQIGRGKCLDNVACVEDEDGSYDIESFQRRSRPERAEDNATKILYIEEEYDDDDDDAHSETEKETTKQIRSKNSYWKGSFVQRRGHMTSGFGVRGKKIISDCRLGISKTATRPVILRWHSTMAPSFMGIQPMVNDMVLAFIPGRTMTGMALG